jgi:hypothetical protein
MSRIERGIERELAQIEAAEGRFAPIHPAPKGGRVVELTQHYRPEAGIEQELAHELRGLVL